jgi:hypothetical protein
MYQIDPVLTEECECAPLGLFGVFLFGWIGKDRK